MHRRVRTPSPALAVLGNTAVAEWVKCIIVLSSGEVVCYGTRTRPGGRPAGP